MKNLFIALFVIALLAGGFFLICYPANAASSEAETQQTFVVRNSDMRTAKASETNFTGDVNSTLLFGSENPTGKSGGIVDFSPGARTAWHDHPNGQLIIITAGSGRVQQWGAQVIEVGQGDVVWFPPNVKHWHGAAPDRAMSHIALADIVDGISSTWHEKVTDDQYNGRDKINSIIF